MKQNHLGFFTKGTRMTIRMTEPLREALAEVAIEERDSMAEVAALAIFDSCGADRSRNMRDQS